MHGNLGNMKLKSAIISVALVCSLVSLSSVCKAESFGFFFEDHGTSFSMRQSTDGHIAPPAPRGDPQHFNHPAPPRPHHYAGHRPPHFDAPPPPPPRHFRHGGPRRHHGW